MASPDVVYQFIDIVQAAAAAENRYLEPPGASGSVWRCTSARFTPATAVTAHDTDYVTLALKKGATTVFSKNTKVTGGSAFVAGTPLALTAGSTVKGDEFTVGTNVLDIDIAPAGGGKVCDGSLKLRWEQLSGAGN